MGEPQPRFTIKQHLLRYAYPSALRRTSMYASILGISQALHLVLAGEMGNPLPDGADWVNTNLTVDLGLTYRDSRMKMSVVTAE